MNAPRFDADTLNVIYFDDIVFEVYPPAREYVYNALNATDEFSFGDAAFTLIKPSVACSILRAGAEGYVFASGDLESFNGGHVDAILAQLNAHHDTFVAVRG